MADDRIEGVIRFTADTGGMDEARAQTERFQQALRAADGDLRRINPDFVAAGQGALLLGRNVQQAAGQIEASMNAAAAAVKGMPVVTGSAASTISNHIGGIVREFTALGDEALRGRFSMMLGSLLVLAQRSGFLAEAVSAVGAGFIAAGAAALLAGGAMAYIAYQAYEDEKAITRAATALQLLGRGGEIANDELPRWLDDLREKTNLSQASVRNLVDQVARIQAFTTPQQRQFSVDIGTMADMFRLNSQEADKFGDTAAKAFASGAAAALKWVEENAELSGSERILVEDLIRAGQGIEAERRLLDDLTSSVREHGGAVHDAAKEWSNYGSLVAGVMSGGAGYIPVDQLIGPAPATMPPPELTQRQRAVASQMAGYLRERYGYTPAQQASLLGQAQAESTFDPTRKGPVTQYGWQAQGMFQWDPSRFAELQKYAQSIGGNWQDWHVQLDFINQEIGKMAPEFYRIQSVAEGTRILTSKVERPYSATTQAPQLEAEIKYRTQMAEALGKGTAREPPEVTEALQSIDKINRAEQQRRDLKLQQAQFEKAASDAGSQAVAASSDAQRQQALERAEAARTALEGLQTKAMAIHTPEEQRAHEQRLANLQEELQKEQGNQAAIAATRQKVQDENVRYQAEALQKGLGMAQQQAHDIAAQAPEAIKGGVAVSGAQEAAAQEQLRARREAIQGQIDALQKQIGTEQQVADLRKQQAAIDVQLAHGGAEAQARAAVMGQQAQQQADEKIVQHYIETENEKVAATERGSQQRIAAINREIAFATQQLGKDSEVVLRLTVQLDEASREAVRQGIQEIERDAQMQARLGTMNIRIQEQQQRIAAPSMRGLTMDAGTGLISQINANADAVAAAYMKVATSANASTSEIQAAWIKIAETHEQAAEQIGQIGQQMAQRFQEQMKPISDALKDIGDGITGLGADLVKIEPGAHASRFQRSIDSTINKVTSGLINNVGKLGSEFVAQNFLGGQAGQGIGDVLTNKIGSLLGIAPQAGVQEAQTAQITAAITAASAAQVTATTGAAASIVGAISTSAAVQAAVPKPFGFATGGVVYAAVGFPARGTDTVPAMLTPGEVVLPRAGPMSLEGVVSLAMAHAATLGGSASVNAPTYNSFSAGRPYQTYSDFQEMAQRGGDVMRSHYENELTRMGYRTS